MNDDEKPLSEDYMRNEGAPMSPERRARLMAYVPEVERLREEVAALRSALVTIRSFHGNSVDPDECMTCENEYMPCRTARAADAALVSVGSSGEAENGEPRCKHGIALADLCLYAEHMANGPAPVSSGGQADGEGEWVCATCGRGSVEHGRIGSTCVYRPAWKPAARPVLSREALAQAWEKGRRMGQSRAMRHMSDEPGLPLASELDNPYLADVLTAGGEQQ